MYRERVKKKFSYVLTFYKCFFTAFFLSCFCFLKWQSFITVVGDVAGIKAAHIKQKEGP